jgi:hypothetical protein
MVLKDGSPALQYARPYLFIRSFAFLPSLLSLIGFSAFRGVCQPGVINIQDVTHSYSLNVPRSSMTTRKRNS